MAVGSCGQIEGLGRRRIHQLERPLIDRLMRGGRRTAMIGDELRLERPPQIDAAGELRPLDAGRQVIDLQLGIAAGGCGAGGPDAVGRADRQRRIPRAEEAGRKRGLIERPIRRNADIVRHGVVFAGQSLRERRANRRILNRPQRLLARANDIRPAAVVAFLGAQAADDRQPIGHLAQLRQVLAESQAGNLRRDFLELAAVGVARLHVERVGLRRTPRHPQQDAMPPPLWIAGQLIGQEPETSRWR